MRAMKPELRAAVAALALLGGVAARAAAPAAAPDLHEPAEPAVQRSVHEDDHVRIEELRVRGEVRSITVQSKIHGVAPYQIVPSSGARDPSVPGNTAGQRLWHFLSF